MTLSKLIESEVADFFAGFGGPGEPDVQSGEAQQLLTARLLSLLERRERDKQEPVAWMTTREGDASFPRLHKEETQADYWVDYCNVGPSIIKHALYAAPPAPVVQVPEWTNEQCIEFLCTAFRHAEIKGDIEMDDIRLGVKMANSMLNGGQP